MILKMFHFLLFLVVVLPLLQFVCNMMLCGKNHNQQTLSEFILESPSPVDVAAKLSRILVSLSGKVNFQNIKGCQLG